MKKLILCLVLGALTQHIFAQDPVSTTTKKKPYFLSVSEIMFSWASVDAEPLDVTSVIRFSPVFNFGQQLHIDFSEKAGFYTGLIVRNVGMINDLNDSVRMKQRVYTVGIPVAFKLGNMKGTHVALGAEGEFAIHYKQKVYENDEKSKSSEWFSDKTNIFLPSAFAEIRTKQGGYIKFKYYLDDFLADGKQKTNVPNLNYNPTKSQLMYVSFGYTLDVKKVKVKGI